jgi:hypothetical protein
MYPIHKSIFRFIESLPTDGTFNQIKPIMELSKLEGIEKYYSFDLSAATDRLPVDIQEQILGLMFKNSNLALI